MKLSLGRGRIFASTAATALARVWHLRRAYQLGGAYCTRVGQANLMARAARLAARDLAGSGGARSTTLDLGSLGAVAVRDFSELLVLWEVLVARVYDVAELPVDAGVIVDAGCNVGASLLWFHARYPRARIIGYEADPLTAELARRNTAGIERIEVHATAVAAADGEIGFHRLPGRSWESGTDVTGGTVLTVPAVSLDTVLRRAGGAADIIKLDIEGAEHAVLAAARLDGVALVLGEYHPAPGASWATLRRALDGFELRPAAAPDGEMRTFVAPRA